MIGSAAVSKDGDDLNRGPPFETHRFAMLLRVRPERCCSASHFNFANTSLAIISSPCIAEMRRAAMTALAIDARTTGQLPGRRT
jgi:hypothetical protein